MRRAIRPLLLASTVLAPGVALAQINPVQSGTPAFLTLQVGPTTPISGFGTAIGQALGPLINFSGSGHPGLLMGDRLILGRSGAGGPSDFAVLQVNRTTTFTGGTTATVNGAIVGNVVIGANDSTQEVGVQGLVNTSGAAGGLSVGVWGQVTRNAGSNDPIWGGLFNAKDNNTATSLISGGQLLGIEVDVNSVRADDGTNVSTWGGTGNRKAIQVSIHRASTDSGTQYEVSNGLWFTTGGVPGSGPGVATDVSYKSAIGFGVNVQAYSALDTRGLIAPTGSSNPVIAVNMQHDQVIDLNGGANLNSAPGAYLQYRTATNRLYYVVGGVDMWSVDASGNVRAKGTLTGSTTP